MQTPKHRDTETPDHLKTEKLKHLKYRLITAERMEERKSHGRENLSRQEKVNALLNELSCSNIDLDEALDNIATMTNKKILEQHPYAVTENKDGRFSTYIADSTKTDNRRKIVKASRELLEKEIIKFYKEREKKNREKKICLKDFYAEWLNYKSLRTNSSAYIKTIDELWKRYYASDKISGVPLVDLDKYTLDVWAHSLIKNNRMTKKQYYNMAVIMRQALELAVEKNIIPENPFSKVKIDRKLFVPVKKKPDETQVYLLNEQPLIEKEAYADFEATGNTVCLAIPFAFQTGMRMSEIVALKWSDIGTSGPRLATTVLTGNQKTRQQKKWKKHWFSVHKICSQLFSKKQTDSEQQKVGKH